MVEKKDKKKITMKRRTTKDELTLHPEWRKLVFSLRLSEATVEMAEYLAERYPGLYYNRSHVIECSVRRLYNLHRKGKIEVMV